MPVERCAERASPLAVLGLLILIPGDLAAQSGAPADEPAAVVRPIEEAPPSAGGERDLAQAAGDLGTGTADRSPFAELNEALAAARAKLEELNDAAAIAASVGQLRQQLEAAHEESRQLRAEITTLQASRHEPESSNQAAQARIAELTAALDEAASDAARLRGEADELQARNAELRAEVAAKEQALSEAAEQAAELMALREELDAHQRAIAIADGGRESAEAQVEELEEAIRRIGEESTGLREELSHARNALASAARERSEAQAESADLRAEADQLRDRLAAAADRASRLEATNARLSAELQEFRAAASNAADAARQNLEVVESQVEALNAALTAAPAGDGPEAALDRLISEAQKSETDQGKEISATAGAEAPVDGDANAIAASQPIGEPQAVGQREQGSPESDLARAKQPDALGSLAKLTAGRPLEKKLQIQALLTELKPETDDRGLLMTVPGGSLFKVNSDDIEETAYDTLAKLAELINAYDDRKVLIVGHTDAIGDAAYNQMLSERRADLVKEFLVDNFEIDSARVSTAGKGEEAPIASNSTNAGRRANRRVEVLLLN